MDITRIIEGIELVDVVVTGLAGTVVVSEMLPFMKNVESNSALQLVFNILRLVGGHLKKNK